MLIKAGAKVTSAYSPTIDLAIHAPLNVTNVINNTHMHRLLHLGMFNMLLLYSIQSTYCIYRPVYSIDKILTFFFFFFLVETGKIVVSIDDFENSVLASGPEGRQQLDISQVRVTTRNEIMSIL